mmetsp:Transcript_18169/g.51248  ORF Transcript_18169/g.51248 Transcript_18169/m.51248 type:complete len:320 (-) Transcript_18169:826-1785(-)
MLQGLSVKHIQHSVSTGRPDTSWLLRIKRGQHSRHDVAAVAGWERRFHLPRGVVEYLHLAVRINDPHLAHKVDMYDGLATRLVRGPPDVRRLTAVLKIMHSQPVRTREPDGLADDTQAGDLGLYGHFLPRNTDRRGGNLQLREKPVHDTTGQLLVHFPEASQVQILQVLHRKVEGGLLQHLHVLLSRAPAEYHRQDVKHHVIRQVIAHLALAYGQDLHKLEPLAEGDEITRIDGGERGVPKVKELEQGLKSARIQGLHPQRLRAVFREHARLELPCKQLRICRQNGLVEMDLLSTDFHKAVGVLLPPLHLRIHCFQVGN